MPTQESSLGKGNHHHPSHNPNSETQIEVSTVFRIPWKERDHQREDLMSTHYLLCQRKQRKGENGSHCQGWGSQGFLDQRVSTSLPSETIAPVFVSDPDEKSICIPVSIFANEGAQIIDTFTLVNSRATGDFINQDLAKKRGYQLQRLFQSLKAQNVDRSAN